MVSVLGVSKHNTDRKDYSFMRLKIAKLVMEKEQMKWEWICITN